LLNRTRALGTSFLLRGSFDNQVAAGSVASNLISSLAIEDFSTRLLCDTFSVSQGLLIGESVSALAFALVHCASDVGVAAVSNEAISVLATL